MILKTWWDSIKHSVKVFPSFCKNKKVEPGHFKSLHTTNFNFFVGILFKDLFIGHETSYNFWSRSIKFIEPLSTEHPPMWFLVLTPILVVLSIPVAFYIFVKNKLIVEEIVNGNKIRPAKNHL